jgi:hypothetical protein
MARPVLTYKEREAVLVLFGSCPHCGGEAPSTRTVRLARFGAPPTRKSVRFQCTDCGLQWGTTFHQLILLCARKVQELGESGGMGSLYATMLDVLKDFAAPETRRGFTKAERLLTSEERKGIARAEGERLGKLRAGAAARKTDAAVFGE